MEPENTPEQNAQLETWAGKRDSILLEISNLQIGKESLEKVNKDLAASSTDIETRMNVIRGRIEELQIKERELPELIRKDVASLQAQKSNLESEIRLLSSLVPILTDQKDSLKKDVDSELAVFEAVKGTALSLEKVVSHVTAVSIENEKRIADIVDKLGTSLEEIVEVNRKNVKETNIVIEKVPAMLVELQKHKLIGKKI